MENKQPENNKQPEGNRIKNRIKNTANNWSTILVSLLIQLPLFLLLRNTMSSISWPLYIDKILLFFILLGVVVLLVKSFKNVVYGLLIFMFIAMVYGMIFDNYSFSRIFKDYTVLLKDLKEGDNPTKIIINSITPEEKDLSPFMNTKILSNDRIKNFANNIGGTNGVFDTLSFYNSAFNIFREVKKEWIFIKDVQDEQHYRAIDIINDMSGDYDEFTIIMISLIKSLKTGENIKVGVLYKNQNEMHPLLLIENESIKNYVSKIVLNNFENEVSKKEIRFITDKEGRTWISLSYSYNYPGGEMPKYNEDYHIKEY